MALISYLSGVALIVVFLGCYVDANIMEVQWKDQNIQIFNRSTEAFYQSTDCQPGFFKGAWRNDHCYMFILTPMTRPEASTFCTEAGLGNGLVAVETELDQINLVGQLSTQEELRAVPEGWHNYWTSGTNVYDGIWRWTTTQTVMTYTKFWSGNTISTGHITLYENRAAAYNSNPYFDWQIWSTTAAGDPTYNQRSICQQFIVHE